MFSIPPFLEIMLNFATDYVILLAVSSKLISDRRYFMLETIKKNLWGIICSAWSLVIALFWFAMRVIWSGISKVISDAFGENTPSDFVLNLPLYVSILLWIIFAMSIACLVWLRGKRWQNITLTALLGVFTVASVVVVIMGAIDYLYFIWPKFFLSLFVSICLVGLALLLFFLLALGGFYSTLYNSQFS